MTEKKVYSMLGLAVKAGKLVSGDGVCEKYIRSGKGKLVIVAQDASLNTKKKYSDVCKYKNLDFRYFGQKELIGKSIGKVQRTVLVLTDQNFAKKILELVDLLDFKDLSGGEAFDKS